MRDEGYAPDGEDRPDVGGVALRLDQLDEALAALGEISETLGYRLSQVMRPEEPQPADPDGRAAAKLAAVRRQSEVADRIEGAAARTRTLTRSLRDTYARLDL